VLHTFQCVVTDIDPQKWAFSVKKSVLPEKPAFNLPAGFFNKTWVFTNPEKIIELYVK
jgi:hypothetical protein